MWTLLCFLTRGSSFVNDNFNVCLTSAPKKYTNAPSIVAIYVCLTRSVFLVWMLWEVFYTHMVDKPDPCKYSYQTKPIVSKRISKRNFMLTCTTHDNWRTATQCQDCQLLRKCGALHSELSPIVILNNNR